MNPYKMTWQGKSKEQRRKIRDFIIAFIALGLFVLLFYFQTHFSSWGVKTPIPRNILVISIISINIILLLLSLFFILRNIIKLIVDRRKRVLGSKLRTKLALFFIIFSLLPSILLFFTATTFLTKSSENWFSVPVENSLQESLVVAQVYYKNASDQALHFARQIRKPFSSPPGAEKSAGALAEYLKSKRGEYNLEVVEVIWRQGGKPVTLHGANIASGTLPALESKIIQEVLRGEEVTKVQSLAHGDLIWGLVPIYSFQNPREAIGILGVGFFVSQNLVSRINEISTAFEEYKQRKVFKGPIQESYLIWLFLVTLAIIILATGVGPWIAKGITEPIQGLVEGTQKITKGNLDFQIPKASDDEIGMLVDSFNQMTQDLKGSRMQVERAHGELSRSYAELEQRRRYMEIILRDIGAGVISIDSEGRIRTINRSAEKILAIRATKVLGKLYTEVLKAEYLTIAEELIRAVRQAENLSITRQIRLTVQNETITLLVKVATLRDEENRNLGMVVVLDDLTQLQKAQRAAAWREVARRIAHEIKNPLTPIQLSAQRLRKRYLEKFAEDGAIFDECTKTIITQVEELKNLVNEFSSFARMPAANPTANQLNEIIREAMVLYEEGHRGIQFQFEPDLRIPVFNLDKEQFKRVMANLLDNSVAAVAHEPVEKRITVTTQFDPSLKVARLDVADNGCGVAPEDKPLLFEPYFSRKASGTGLGLAIVNTIVSDHDGYIRVKDNIPKGTRFIIELPIKQETVRSAGI